jgi:hypothetical protein
MKIIKRIIAIMITLYIVIAFLSVKYSRATSVSCLDKVPNEQAQELRTANYIFPSPPNGFNAVLGWANVVIGKSQFGTEGNVTVKTIELWEVTKGIRRLVTNKITCPQCTLPQDKVFGFLVPKHLWMVRSAWDKENQGQEFTVNADGSVGIPAELHPDHIYHFWHTDWPRPNALSNSQYYLRAIVEVSGNAMIQVGFDYYGSPDSLGYSNIEAANSDWYCAKPGWQEVIAGIETGHLPIPIWNMLLLKNN